MVVEANAHDLRAHIVKQVIAVGVNGLVAQPRQLGAIEQLSATGFGVQCGDMTQVALGLEELLFADGDHLAFRDLALFVADLCGRATQPSGRNAQSVQVEIDIFHILCRDLQLVVEQSHHRPLLHLVLPLTDLLGVAAVGDAHIAGEAQLHGEVGVLCLVARESQLQTAALCDVVGAP